MNNREQNRGRGPTSSFVDPAQRVKAVNARKAGVALRRRFHIPSPLKAIRDNCLECAGGSPAAVKNCAVTHCRMWPYRFGRNPKRSDLVVPANGGEEEAAGQTNYPGYPDGAKKSGDLK